MKSYYNKIFTADSPFMFVFLIIVMVIGFLTRQEVAMPAMVSADTLSALTKFGLSAQFIKANFIWFLWLEFILNMGTMVALFALGKAIVGRTAGICSAFLFAIYPYFSINMYSMNIYLFLSFVLYLLFMYIGINTMLKRYNFLSGIFFTLALIIEPTCLLLGIIPYIYFLIKQTHTAVLHAFLYFLVGVIITLGIFIFIAHFKGYLASLLPLDNYFSSIWINIKQIFTHPLRYLNDTILPYFSTFKHPLVSGTNSYSHYVIITLSVLGALYALIQENVRILAILLISIFFLAFFMTFEYSIVFMMLILLAGFMIDKVIGDVFKI